MAESSVVSAGDDILASQYNNLQKDVLDTSLGHTHNGTDSKITAVDGSTIEHSGASIRVKDDGITGAKINSDVADASTIEQTGTTLNVKLLGVTGGHLANDTVTGTKLADAVAGDGIQKDGSENLEVDASAIAGTGLEDDGFENLRIAAAAAGDGLQGGAGLALAVNVSDFAGNALADSGSENLDVQVDDSSIEIITNALRIKTDGVTGAKINSNVVDGVTLEQTGTTLNIKAEGVGASKLGDAASYANARTRYYMVTAADLIERDASSLTISNGQARSTTAAAINVAAPIHLPNGAIITSFKAYWYRDDAAASGTARLKRLTISDGTYAEKAAADSDSSSGYHSVEDTSITSPTIANTSYAYIVEIVFDPNDAATDVTLLGIAVTYTVLVPLP